MLPIAKTPKVESEIGILIRSEKHQQIKVQTHHIIKMKTVVDGRQLMLNIIPKDDKKALFLIKGR